MAEVFGDIKYRSGERRRRRSEADLGFSATIHSLLYMIARMFMNGFVWGEMEWVASI